MKVSFSDQFNRRQEYDIYEPVISITKEKGKAPSKSDYEVRKCRIKPGDNKSAECDVNVECFSHGSPEKYLTFLKTVKRVVAGQNLDFKGQFTLYGQLLKGPALTYFEERKLHHCKEDERNLDERHLELALSDLKKRIFPTGAGRRQKRHMRCIVRKQREMGIRNYVDRLTEINNLLPQFPRLRVDEPAVKKLNDDELKEAIQFSMPPSWKRQMDLQGFDPFEKEMEEFIAASERLERHEDEFDKDSNRKHKGRDGRNKNDGKGRHSNNSNNNKGKEPCCEIHGCCDHNAGGCDEMKRLAKQAKKDYEEKKKKRKNYKGNNGNKGFVTKKELNHCFEQFVAEKKKRKRNSDSNDEITEGFEQLHFSNSGKGKKEDSDSDSDEE